MQVQYFFWKWLKYKAPNCLIANTIEFAFILQFALQAPLIIHILKLAEKNASIDHACLHRYIAVTSKLLKLTITRFSYACTVADVMSIAASPKKS